MRKIWFVLAFVIFLVIIASFYFLFLSQRDKEQLVVTEIGPDILSVEDEIEESFRIEIPDDVEKLPMAGQIEDEDVVALATRKIDQNGSKITILLNVPDGDYYAGIVSEVLGEDPEIINLGKFKLAKGGYLIEFSDQKDLSAFDRVVISTTPVSDELPGTTIFDAKFE